MEIRPIYLSLKRNKFMTILMIIQIAFTMGVLSSSVFIAVETLSEWNLPSGIPHEDIVRTSPQSFDENQNFTQLVVKDIERLQQLPAVMHVAPSNAVPFTAENVVRVYKTAQEEAQEYSTVIFDSNEKLMDVLQLKLIAGRAITANDVITGALTAQQTPSVVMISEEMAQALYDENSAIGETLWLAKGNEPVKIVGVYSNFMNGERLNGRGQSYRSIIRPQVKSAMGQEPSYLIRFEPNTAEQHIEDILSVIHAEQGRYNSATERLVRVQKRMYDGRGSRALTFLTISAILLIITALGITGLTAFQVTQKRAQIGTRRALGAKKSDILRYFLLENSLITLIGLIIGIGLTFTLTFELSEQAGQNFFNISVLLLTALLLWLVNILAVWFPAKQAANIAPAIVTRNA